MAYSKNPLLPRARMSAVLLVRRGWSVRQTARHFSVSPGTVSKWVKKAPEDGRFGIPTSSSRPRSSPGRVDWKIERAIVEERLRHNRCGQVVHHELAKQGVEVSLSTVHRVLDRRGLTKKRNPWKRRHGLMPRPGVAVPGDLVEVDTIHQMVGTSQRMYVYALIDLASRWAWAWACERINPRQSVRFVILAQDKAAFPFLFLQSDNGQEFSTHFSERVRIPHRHTRVRRPNDNGHVERFNRTVKEECLSRLPRDPRHYNAALKEWLKYYNEQRPHMGINYLTPMEKVNPLFPRS